MILEDLLGSKTKVRILRVLVKYGEINMTALSREALAPYLFTRDYVTKLKKYGLVEEKKFGRIRIIKLISNDIRVQSLIDLFNTFENLRDSYKKPRHHEPSRDLF